MVMQDGGTVDVRPGSDPGRAAPEHSGAYLASGLCLVLYGAALLAWTVYGLGQADTTAWDFVEGLFNPGATPAPQVLGPYEWAFTVAFLAVGGLTLAQRRTARSAALLCGFLLLAVSLREGVGLFNAAYRDQYSNDPLGGWALATRGLGLVTALVVLAVLRSATERAADAAPVSPMSARRRRHSRICGVLFLITAAVRVIWTVRALSSSEMATTRYLRGAVDGSVLGTLDLSASTEFTTVSSVLVLLILGVIALRGHRDIRGALLVFAAVELYLTVRTVVLLAVTDFFSLSSETPEGALSMATTAYALAAMTSVVVLATGRAYGPYGGVRGALGPGVPSSE
ncbi:hypothetical protein [Streptomyces gilvosporeus]|uniref:Uncharacterized protein n=1 Tax=Streptomyces gilvosporeus TaxID=553510 RepID=A0A1V0TVW5_9ACTN|nr:hypothetical protein [Streptomyces gilvosporeus]ARF56990.1 hypothetical protein B1H19_24970 [Streptomyces gilvosporeus]